MKYLIGVLGIAFMILFFSGCTGMRSAINGEEASGKTYGNLLVIGAYDERQYRVSSEEVFTRVLKKEGIGAAPSYNLLPGLENIQNDTEVAGKLKSTDYDGILIVSVLSKQIAYDLYSHHASKGLAYLLDGRPPRATERGSFLAWAGTGSYDVYIGLWDAETLRPVWNITTDAKTTGSDTQDNKIVAEFVAEQLKKRGLVTLKGK